MKVICVDDEPLVLQLTASMCRELPQFDEVECFAGPTEALEWMENNTPDLALLDIDMPTMNGITLAVRMKIIHPETAIIFLTGYAQYAIDAFSLHASGYLLKPISRERLYQEVEYALSGKHQKCHSHIQVQTFGNFDVFVEGKTVTFTRSKSKELLAYLIDRQGSSITRAEAFSILWEDEFYDRAKQKQLDVIIRSLRTTLREYEISDIVEMQGGTLRVIPEMLDCDLYRLFEGDVDTINDYRGEYMSSYSWASLTEAYIDRFIRK